MRGFDHINAWVFDLDNTLYPASCRLFDQMHVRMSEFIQQAFKVDEAEANRRRRTFYTKYGTTLRGLMLEHDMQPKAFLDYVHEIDYSAVKPDAHLCSALAKLPGRKLVFTNGTTGHAQRVMKRLGVEDHFEGIFDIVDSDYIPKPTREPYDKFEKTYLLDSSRAAMFEDLPQNLEAPHAMGMTTVLITSEPQEDSDAHVHHKTNNLAAFLAGVLNNIKGAAA
jgi:putative hydrolase of the HAD superfamily